MLCLHNWKILWETGKFCGETRKLNSTRIYMYFFFPLLISLLIKLTEAFQRRGEAEGSKEKSRMPETSSLAFQHHLSFCFLALSPLSSFAKLKMGQGLPESQLICQKHALLVVLLKTGFSKKLPATHSHTSTHVKVRCFFPPLTFHSDSSCKLF